jgi:hypothetical protein
LWHNQCDIQELARRVKLKLKFAALGVIYAYQVIGGIIHLFLNLAFPGYEWQISLSDLFYSWARNQIPLD